MNIKRTLPVFAMVAMLALAGCAHQQSLIVSGETLAQVGNTFSATVYAMEQAHIKKVVTDDQYKKWMTFGSKFVQSYPSAVQLWRVAKASGDKTLEQQIMAIVSQMLLDLSEFATLAGVK